LKIASVNEYVRISLLMAAVKHLKQNEIKLF